MLLILNYHILILNSNTLMHARIDDIQWQINKHIAIVSFSLRFVVDRDTVFGSLESKIELK